MVVLRCIRYEPVATSTATAANQADQETATSSVVFTNPASQQFHPSSAKAWVQYNQSTGPSVVSSYNVTSVTDGGAGLYTVNWGNDFASAAYSTLVSTQGAGAGNSAVTCSIVSASKAAGSALFLTQQLTSALDRDDNCVAAYGELA